MRRCYPSAFLVFAVLLPLVAAAALPPLLLLSAVCRAQGAAPPAQMTGDPRPLAGFEQGEGIAPFSAASPENAARVTEHATEGRYALRLNRGFVSWDGPQDWTGYDFFRADVFNAGREPVQVYVEIQDTQTTGYWTRVNYSTVAPPGASTLLVPVDIYVGEKSRPGRQLDAAHIKRLVLSVGDGAKAPLFFDNLRLERDLSDSVRVPGLRAFSFGPGTSPPLRGFTAVTPNTQYTAAQGYGLKNARVWRAFDVLQPDPLYSRFICIESGGFAVDVPDGKYHVFVNLDNPSGFWGEFQVYRERVVKANGVEVARDTMDLARFRKRYFRFADTEDRPDENTFDKYQRAYFTEKEFDVEVRGGQLFLEFIGQGWANSVSALVLYPAEQAEQGRKYLANLRERRRFHFDNYFQRVLPDGQRDSKGAIPAFAPSATETTKGYALFARDWMEDVPVNAVPRRSEVTRSVSVFASAGELEPVVFSVYPLRDIGAAKVQVTDLAAPGGGRIPASAVRLGVVSHRITRVTSEGTVYTISPRYVMPKGEATLRKGATTTFWLTLRVPKTVKAGEYAGRIRLLLPGGKADTIDLRARIFATPLDELDVAAGPWGSDIPLPWFAEEMGEYRRTMYVKSLAKMREYGCTTFSGIPALQIRGWSNGRPDIDFSQADREMADAKAAGFKRVVINYNGGIRGFDNYRIDEDAMKAAGFSRYVDFLRAVLEPVDAHAKTAGWLPVAFNLCDEPLEAAIPPATENALAWREAAPPTLLTTGATSLMNPRPDDPHLPLARALKIANVNLHDEAAIRAIREAGSDWAFYNGGNRWTFGTYMYRCAKEYEMKFRLSWHWNASAGDPYYALDSREDDYSWCMTNARGEMIPSILFEREIREGIDDYRYMLTLSRLIRQRPRHPQSAAARKLIADKMASFKLGERDHDAKWPVGEYRTYRRRLAEAIGRLSL